MIKNVPPRGIRNNLQLLQEFQTFISEKLGVELSWPEDARLTPRVKNDPLGI